MKTIESVMELLGRKPDKMEMEIFKLLKDDDTYEFKKGRDGYLEGHKKSEHLKVSAS